MCARWSETLHLDGSVERVWDVLGLPEFDDVRMQLYSLAYEGGMALAAKDEDPFTEWLELLKFLEPNMDSVNISSVIVNNVILRQSSGSISKLADTSVKVCRQYVIRALEDNFMLPDTEVPSERTSGLDFRNYKTSPNARQEN